MSHPITLSILNAYFSRVYSLQAYLNVALIPPTDKEINNVLILPQDSPSYGQFLAQSYVAFSDGVPPTEQTRFNIDESFDSMRVVCLLLVFEALIVGMRTHRSSRELKKNCLRAQSRKALTSLLWGIAVYVYFVALKLDLMPPFFSKSYQSGSKMRAGDTRSGVNNFFVNTNVTALQESNWERLLRRYVVRGFQGRSSRVVCSALCQDRRRCHATSANGSEHIRPVTQ